MLDSSLQFILLMTGLLLLWGGAELLVRNAVILAKAQGVRPIIIGLTLVSFGTSAPELVVSNLAALQGATGISMGNIIGSNIANIALILGIGALISPLAIEDRWVQKETPIMLLVTGLFIYMAYSGRIISTWEGALLLLLVFGMLLYLARVTRKDMNAFKTVQKEMEEAAGKTGNSNSWKHLIFSLLGLAILLGGSKLSVDSGTALAEQLDVSHTIIGLTFIALGTSLQELATTIISAIRKASDIAVGNIIGSNIFNLALIGGSSAVIRPLPCNEPKMLVFELPFLAAVSLLIWVLMGHHRKLNRLKGAILVAVYFLFLYITVVH